MSQNENEGMRKKSNFQKKDRVTKPISLEKKKSAKKSISQKKRKVLENKSQKKKHKEKCQKNNLTQINKGKSQKINPII